MRFEGVTEPHPEPSAGPPVREQVPVGTGTGPGVEPEPPDVATVFGDRLPLARAYVQLLAGDGVVRGLIGPREAGRLWTRHVLNCATPAELIPEGAKVVDVGSGAGLPGVVVAIARPDCRVILVEPLERRVRFLTEVVDQLGLANCRVVRSRALDAPDEAREADVVISRAVAPLGRLAAWCAGLARPGGLVLALKGATAQEELDRDRPAMAAAGLRGAEVLRLTGTGGPAFVVRAERGRIPDSHRRQARGVSARRGRQPGRGSVR